MVANDGGWFLLLPGLSEGFLSLDVLLILAALGNW